MKKWSGCICNPCKQIYFYPDYIAFENSLAGKKLCRDYKNARPFYMS